MWIFPMDYKVMGSSKMFSDLQALRRDQPPKGKGVNFFNQNSRHPSDVILMVKPDI